MESTEHKEAHRRLMASVEQHLLASVDFIEDYYVEFKFDCGSVLRALTPATLESHGRTHRWGDTEYKDALLGLEDKRATSMRITDQDIAVTFEDGSRLTISLTESRVGPEAANFITKEREFWVW